MNALRFSRKHLGIPYIIFLSVFVILPLVLIVLYAFTDSEWHFTLNNFADFFLRSGNLKVLAISFGLALLTTVICILIAYPVAYVLAQSKLKASGIYLLLFILPMWINFVLRTAAVKELLYMLDGLGIYDVSENYFLSTIIGMVYDYLPFSILPIYTVLIKIDKSAIEASMDLGANPVQTFFRTTLPLSMPGIMSAVTMVFLPTTTTYVIADTLGNSKVTIIGNLIKTQFDAGTAESWHVGSAISLVLLVIIFASMLFSGKLNENDQKGGASKW
ncbi:MAG: ABC transporter permease [Clostridia bacterium]|nr:ABC transporter permease [Clostridia bacterium]